MSYEFSHINDARSFIAGKLSEDSLLGRGGYMMRNALYVLDYKPEQEAFAQDLLHAIYEFDLPARSVHPKIINLYDIVLAYLDEQGMWDALVEAEADASREELIMMLQDTVSVRDVIAPAVNQAIAQDSEADIVFICGVGETFPYIRTHTLLQELQSKIPVVLMFPGRFERRSDGSTSLNILNLDQGITGGYYRATRVFDL
ncbi:MAG: DUF1788 domain-containing protein [Coriobacteriales bacterium]|nr:DUF1788 domain-containing protein [Coriobacteriales bacterium]